jgi:uncharacterized protein YcbK (DUF882 family)
MLAPGMLTPHFALVEFACRDGHCVPDSLIPNVQRLADELEVLRVHLGKPVVIRSAYRTTSHNAKVGGAKRSRHLTGEAADIVVASMLPSVVRAEINDLIRAGKMRDGGVGAYHSFTHYDVGRPRRWRAGGV